MSANVIDDTKIDNANVVWRPTPKQAEFLSAPQREVLFGGSLHKK